VVVTTTTIVTLDASQSMLYVAQDNADQVAVIDTSTNTVKRKIDARAPQGVIHSDKYTGAATFAVTLSPDGHTLYAVNSGANSIAVIPLTGGKANRVTALIPTAYEPHDVTFSADGSYLYIVNGKSVTGPNPGHLAGNTAAITSIIYPGGNAAAAAAARASNEYQFRAGDGAPEPEHRLPAADGGCLRHPRVRQVGVHRRGVDGAGDDDCRARVRQRHEVRRRPDDPASARRRVLGFGDRGL
jgi:YVTN family beta-propeller protein